MKRLFSFVLATVFFGVAISTAVGAEKKPNVIFILADDLGYGDLGCFGQTKILTPNLDQLAAEGIRLTNFYAGCTVCAPSRSVLMTGQHTGQTWVRGNAGAGNREAQTLRAEDVTVAEMLKTAGYETALIGKWGLGELGSTGHPNAQGFDYFYGYLNQRHAHNYYPTFLIRNSETVPLKNVVSSEWEAKRVADGAPDDGAGWAHPEGRIEYSHDLVAAEALQWIDQKAGGENPFFLYLALTVPHANNEGTRGTGNGQEVPDYGIYADKDWTEPNKGQAAMITRMDGDIGRIVALLKEKGIAEDTLVFFTSDNGHHKEGGNDPEFFDANGPLRGMKRDLSEGGIRVPAIGWWPGKIEPGTVSDHAAYFADFMATACELSGVTTPEATAQSISFLPTLLGKPEAQKDHEYLYWEFYEGAGKQAVRFDQWKAIRQPMFEGKVELYDVSKDLGEENDVASEHPDLVAKAIGFMKEAHVPNPNWKPRAAGKKKSAK
ncbi:MAG: arylsulfatase [Verrucomicrobiae bacterium]|nr:arylsulfatase [Verrucomicrobiae bacterium]